MSCNRKKNDGKNSLISIVVTVLLLAIILILVLLLIRKERAPQPQEGTPVPTVTPVLSPIPSPAPSSASPTGTNSPESSPTPMKEYDYSEPVKKSATVSPEYFTDAVFIGDSRMEDFASFSGIAKYATFYTHIGMTVNHLITEDSEEIIRFKVKGENLTLEEALRKYNDFSKVYIMLGYNELGWPDPESFITYYTKVLNIIKTVKPGVQIYVECVIPVAREITGIGVDPETENNENIALFNRYIQKMCKEQKVYYLNVQEALVDSEGYLPDGAASDGIHMKKEYCVKWFDYIRSHVV